MNPYVANFVQVGSSKNFVVQFLQGDGTARDISLATSLAIKIGYPDGTTKDFAASFWTNGTDGKIVYTTAPGDISEVGTYWIQGKIVMNGLPDQTQNDGILNAFYAFANVDNS